MGYTAVIFLNSEKKSNEVTIGKIQTDVINVFQDAEKTLFYLDQSAKYSAYKTTEEITLKGISSNCGIEENYILWKSDRKECYPDEETLKKSFIELFSKNLDIYLEEYNKINKNDLTLNNYNLELEETNELKITGNAKEDFKIKQQEIDYSNMPNFITKIDYNFTDHLDISKDVKELINKCNNDLTCWKSDSKSINWKIKQKGNLFMFDVTTNRKTIFSEENIIIKFGINFNQLI